MIKKLLFNILIVLLPTVVFAQKTYNSTSGNWNVAANWTPNGVPTLTDDVIIPSGKTVTVTANASANNLVIIGTGVLTVNNGITLTVYGNVNIDSGAQFNSGTGNSDSAIIKVYGDFINQGTANFWKSTVVIGGNLITASTILQNNGNIIVGGNVSGVIGGSGTGIVYPVNPNATVTVTGDATEKPAGTIPTDPTLISLMNEVIYGSNCSFTITGTTNVSACIGATAIFTVSTSGSSPSYQWEVNMGSGWSDLSNNAFYSGVNTANLGVNNITAGMNNYKFRAKITAGGCTEKGNYGFLTVRTSPSITTQPINQLDCEKRSVNFSVVAAGTGLTYSWKYKKLADASFTTITVGTSNVSNPETSTISIANIGSAQFPNGTQFQVVVSNGTCDVSSSLATLSVNLITDITSGTTVTLCYGSNHFYTVTIMDPSNVVSYKWKKSVTSGVWNDVVDGTHYSGTSTATLNIINGTPNESAEYRVYITFRSSGADCNVSSDSRTRALTFLPLLLTPATLIAQPTCSTPTGGISVTVQSANDTYSFDNGATYQASNVKIGLVAGTYNVIIKNIGGCISSAMNCVIAGTVVTTWNGSAWSPSAPKSIDKMILNGNYLSTGDISGCSCQINSGAVVINSGHTLSLTNELTVSGGSLTFENNSSLVQINDVVNTGNITYKRITTPIRKFDYTYWSSPVVGYTLGGVSPNTSLFYSFDAAADNWKPESATTVMSKGMGYIVRGPQNYDPVTAAAFPAVFVGVPNNGAFSLTGISADKLYLIGNPYPSALDAYKFLTDNSSVLDGTLYFWTHNTAIQLATNITNGSAGSGTYAYTSDDYAAYNLTGGVGTSALSDSNHSVAGVDLGLKPSGKIASGQAFFAGTQLSPTSNQIVFNNTMRVGVGSITGNNSQFFKITKNEKITNAIEKHRIWLNLTNTQGAFKQMLVGYVTNATNEYDNSFDGESFDGNDFVDFYSVNEDKNLTIQGRALPFDENDEVPLGYSSTIKGAFSITIDEVDGLLASQDIFIEDKSATIVQNLKQGAYNFSTEAGTFNDRFVLRYNNINTNKSLGTYSVERLNSSVVVSNKNKHIKINSSDEIINKVQVFDLLGNSIYQKNNVNSNESVITNLAINHQIVLVKIVLQNGKTVTKKIVN
ncbi:T9SS sorting signal type C domain-containing protein [Flavobacterium sp. LB3P45]|uniref:T9SS sorting signal type C domain-containing protein n=1 Tax=Flavobacterium fructosi TaxID=3230416 RepID=A0ABW6HK41_9FLAO